MGREDELNRVFKIGLSVLLIMMSVLTTKVVNTNRGEKDV